MKVFFKYVLKTILTLLGLAVFIYCICWDVTGVGRFACLFSGTVFTLVGSYLDPHKPPKKPRCEDEHHHDEHHHN